MRVLKIFSYLVILLSYLSMKAYLCFPQIPDVSMFFHVPTRGRSPPFHSAHLPKAPAKDSDNLQGLVKCI